MAVLYSTTSLAANMKNILTTDTFAWMCKTEVWEYPISQYLAEWIGRSTQLWIPLVQFTNTLIFVSSISSNKDFTEIEDIGGILETLQQFFPTTKLVPSIVEKDTYFRFACGEMVLLEIMSPYTYCKHFPSVGPARLLYDFSKRLWRDAIEELHNIVGATTHRGVKTSREIYRKALTDCKIILDLPIEPPSVELFDTLIAEGWTVQCSTNSSSLVRGTLLYVHTNGSSKEQKIKCSICQASEGQRAKREIWKTLKCGHTFHFTCSEQWAFMQEGQNSCALCRAVSDV